MKLIERYIFRKMFRAFALSLTVLAATVWLSQALREFDLVTAMGQTLVTFFTVTLLLLPALATIVSPVALIDRRRLHLPLAQRRLRARRHQRERRPADDAAQAGADRRPDRCRRSSAR